ncbi:DUF1127 domain-containing protein [Frigidibacter albus]|uniref:DUF1127 domain-containing protein n=1 Tax=Frigidibacter albus TaxID=1465486 RepID=A0A6L8VGN0_9RHOB|nr:DUF1127 domain-containing protein [Frigidibacter albus]MZQ88370.1 DUF1127 domain-containing protein [Frigidibacter albus]NBE29956.1 DUF1127 domain-containing protein [Frigidibacter albus]GGH45793.1 hypothetical protein GCM10011341_05870 [Frigidibacter albus]
MAYTAHHDTFTPTTGFKAFLARIGAAFARYAERQSRSDQIAKLDALSDAELAKLGLTRDGIVHHVFRDKMYV